jgi:hypothetical protein
MFITIVVLICGIAGSLHANFIIFVPKEEYGGYLKGISRIE